MSRTFAMSFKNTVFSFLPKILFYEQVIMYLIRLLSLAMEVLNFPVNHNGNEHPSIKNKQINK